ncbi:hypothetical protein [Streptomyces sp. NPDC047968]|uniref:hypothetical protein n=1 Tax=unclassified Streptomyces TaxID=2593676 RepID=UPI00341EE848
MPTSNTSATDDLYAALIAERYGRPLHEILQEETKAPLPQLLLEQHRRPAPTTPPRKRQPGTPDPEGPARLRVLEWASQPRHRRTG